jgi:hypothetical protein
LKKIFGDYFSVKNLGTHMRSCHILSSGRGRQMLSSLFFCPNAQASDAPGHPDLTKYIHRKLQRQKPLVCLLLVRQNKARNEKTKCLLPPTYIKSRKSSIGSEGTQMKKKEISSSKCQNMPELGTKD